MKSKPQSIQKILSCYFSLIMLTLSTLSAIIISVIAYQNLRSNNERNLQRLCNSIAQNIDLQISQMDNVCLNTIHSPIIKETFDTYIADTNATAYEKTQMEKVLAGNMTAVKGVDSSIRQINIYDISSGGYGVGNYTGYLNVNAAEEAWFNPTTEMRGKRYIPSAGININFSSGAGTSGDRRYLSLFRMYYDDYHNPAGFVEVMKYYDILLDSAYYPDSDYNVDITIYDTEGNIVFPLYIKSSKVFPYFEYKDSDTRKVSNHLENRTEYLYFADMEYSDFTVVTTIDSKEFLTPIYYSICSIVCVCLIVFALCLVFSHMLAQRLSAPMKKMYRFLYNTDPKKQFRELEMDDTGIIELNKLYNSLNEAMHAQKTATDTMLLMKEHELQSQMLALQSQMNPHFLYNSLSTVAAMAEEGMVEPVVQMCQDITEILRYISSNKEPVTTLEEEMEHCNLYLQCMKLRFQDSLQYDFDIHDDLLEFPIPKLCIQLLVENAVKFTTRQSPPWHIRIRGHIDDICWYIEVQDNGPGFSEEKMTQLRAQMDEILKNGLLPSLAIDGMGVLNIFIRFYLIYGLSFVFDFGNLPDGGATVIVGGRFDDQTKSL